MKDLIIFGAGSFADVAHFYFSKGNEYHIRAFAVDPEYLKSHQHNALPVIDTAVLAEKYPPGKFDAFVAIGYSQMNKAREAKFYLLKKMGYRLATYISPQCTNYCEEIGENCFILEDNTLQPFTKIGHNVTLWSGNHIGHHAEIGDHCFIASHAVISGGVKVGNNCFIGVNATLRDHIRIGNETLIGAGALVLESTAEKSVYTGAASKPSKITSNRVQKI